MAFNTKRDPLLAAAKVMLLVAQIGMAIGFVVCAIILGAILIAPGQIPPEAGTFEGADRWAMAGVMALALALIALAFCFVEELRRIVRTVDLADPFIPANAIRLTRMAWYAVGSILLQIPLGLLDAPHAEAAGTARNGGGDFAFEGLVLILVLFILARVFRKGAEMREDLEGTV